MYISIKVIVNAGKNEIISRPNAEWTVRVTATPERGKANKRVLELLADHFEVPVSSILIVKGKYHSRKVINIVKP